MDFDREYFQKFGMSEDQVSGYFNNAKKDLKIAEDAKEAEVIFTFAYQALLKFGIASIAQKGYKVKSRQGHHVQIIRKLAEILKDEKVEIYGEAMRRKRNIDLYAGGSLVTEKEAREYLDFVKGLLS